MAVYKKTYTPYSGPLTAPATRFTVLPRYALEDLRRSRFLTIFYIASFIYPLICALIIYVQHNTSALKLINFQGGQNLISINATFFLNFMGWQSMLALFIAAFIGPGQVSPDLANGALPLYLARPFSRVEYVIGRMAAIVGLMSMMTWVPGLLLFALETDLEGWSWAQDNMRLGWGIFFGSWLWILILALLSLALSAWVKWKPAAGALVFGIFFVAAAFGAMVNTIQRTTTGNLFNIGYLIGSVWVRMMDAGPARLTNGGVFFRVPQGEELPLTSCLLVLAFLIGACLYMLSKRIRGAAVAS